MAVRNSIPKTHCRRGHPLSGDNLYPSDKARGVRACRACANQRTLENHHRKAALAPRPQHRVSAYERIIAKSERRGGCLVWTGALDSKGYAIVQDRYQTRRAHRIVYEHHNGPVPDGFEIDHVRDAGCSSRACCEISHLEAVTHTENVRRGSQVTKTHCRHGHLLTLAAAPKRAALGWRECVTCKRAAARRSKEKRAKT